MTEAISLEDIEEAEIIARIENTSVTLDKKKVLFMKLKGIPRIYYLTTGSYSNPNFHESGFPGYEWLREAARKGLDVSRLEFFSKVESFKEGQIKQMEAAITQMAAR